MNPIISLWENETLPIKDGLYFADGRSYEAIINSTTAAGYEIANPINLDLFIEEDSECISSFDTTKIVQLPGKNGFLCCGEGSFGSEGFFAHLASNKSLLWVFYFEYSNPFVEIQLAEEGEANFLTSNGTSLKVKIANPELT